VSRSRSLHDQPGEVSFVDLAVKRRGEASTRLEHFSANPHDHARVMQEVRLRPHRSYRVSLWVKTEALQPVSAFQMSVLAKSRSLAPLTFKLPATGDYTGSWKHIPKDLFIAAWGGAPREASLRFFSDEGSSTLVVCYYDAANLDDVVRRLAFADRTPNVRGFMYTSWEENYDLLPAFGYLLRVQRWRCL
jgi:hypothetical protein